MKQCAQQYDYIYIDIHYKLFNLRRLLLELKLAKVLPIFKSDGENKIENRITLVEKNV